MANPWLAALAGGLSGFGDWRQAQEKRQQQDFTNSMALETARRQNAAQQAQQGYYEGLIKDREAAAARNDLNLKRDDAERMLNNIAPHTRLDPEGADYIRSLGLGPRLGLDHDAPTPGAPMALPGGAQFKTLGGPDGAAPTPFAPGETPAAPSIPGFSALGGVFDTRAPTPKEAQDEALLASQRHLAELLSKQNLTPQQQMVVASMGGVKPGTLPAGFISNLAPAPPVVKPQVVKGHNADGSEYVTGVIPEVGKQTQLGKPPVKPSGTAGPRPLTTGQDAAIIKDLNAQWTKATAPARIVNSQVSIMREGLKAAAQGDRAAGFQAVLVTFQKILDPTSVVRESEYARSAAGQALLARAQGYMEQLARGGTGMPLSELRRFSALAENVAKTFSKGYVESVKKRLSLTADRYKIPQELIFDDISLPEDTSVTSAADFLAGK